MIDNRLAWKALLEQLDERQAAAVEQQARAALDAAVAGMGPGEALGAAGEKKVVWVVSPSPPTEP